MLVNNISVTFLTITEHWKSDMEISAYKIHGLNLITSFCRDGGNHGGCAVYCRNGIECKERSDLKMFSVPFVYECSAVETIINGIKYVIISVYRPNTAPKADIKLFFDQIYTMLDKLVRENTRFILSGDFNIDLLSFTKETKKFTSLIESFNSKFLIKVPTRVTPTSATCIDNIITNLDCDISQTCVFPSHISDHLAQTFSFSCKPINPIKKIKKRLINDTNIDFFLTAIQKAGWEDILDATSDLDSLWDRLFMRYKNIFDKAFPEVQITEKRIFNSFKPTRELIDLKNLLDSLYVISRFRPEGITVYNKIKKQFDETLKELKKTQFKEKIINSENKSKTVWSIISDLTGRSISFKKDNFNICDDPTDLANKINQHFLERVSYTNRNDFSIGDNIINNRNSFFIFPVDGDEVIRAVQGMKSKCSSGDDGIPVLLLKKSIHLIAKPLAHLIYRAFTEGVFPSPLKMGIVKPLFKRGNPNDIENYRPICLLTSFSKIFEKIFANRLRSFFNRFSIFSKAQHGFLSGRNTTTAVYELTQTIITILESGEIPLGIFMDLSKAFDCVNHTFLLRKLEILGIRDKQLEFVRNYLKNRLQKVKIEMAGKTYFSSAETVDVGVPQGSILGPLLFVIYINDLPMTTDNKIIMYADDTNALISGRDLDCAVAGASNTYRDVLMWCEQNHLSLNAEKTEAIIFRSSHSLRDYPQEIVLDKSGVSLTDHTKFLGVIVDFNLNWKLHVDYLSRKLNSVLYTLRVLSQQVDLSVLRIVYHANFESRLRYGIAIWGNSSDVQRVFVIQKSAMRAMLRMGYRESCRGVFRRMNLMTVSGLYVFECLCFIRKNSHYFESFINRNNTRRVLPYNFPIHSLTLSEKNLQYMSMKLLNVLPRYMHSVTVFGGFRSKLSELIIKVEPYTVDEFLNFDFSDLNVL